MASKGNDISAVVNHLHEEEARWFAVRTKYKAEKYVADHLERKRIHCYLPLLEVTKRYTSKVKVYDIPLINCFVFVKIVRSEYVRVLETEYVHGFIKQRDSLVSIPDREIQILRKVVGEIEDLESGPIKYEEGQPVEIISGNLTGIKGTLVRRKSKSIFVVNLDYVGVQLEMEVDKSLLSISTHKARV